MLENGEKITSFELESNPFERSFATKEGEETTVTKPKQQPALLVGNAKLPRITPPIFTPGGRRLHPLGISPGGHLSNPDTPGTHLWNSLLTSANAPGVTPVSSSNVTTNNVSSNSTNTMASNLADVNSFRQFVGTLHKTGLTPSESNLRTGLTPGGFPFGQLPGLNSPMTPGLLSLLGIDSISQANVPPQAQAQSQNSAQLDQSIQNANAQINQDIQNAQINQAQIQNVQNAQKAQIAQNVLLQNAHINQIQAQQQNVHTNTNKRKSSVGQPKSKSRKIKLEIDEEDEDDMEPSSPEDPLKPPKTEAEKRKNFLERNRVAASKCRQRKKQLLQKMEDELSFYSTGYRELSSHVSQLRDALLSLKELADLHKDLVPPEVLQQCSYVLTLTAGNSGNVTSIPSTIPTTLQSVEAPIQYQPQSTSSNNSYEINNQNLQDLPQSVNENGELRAIHSMSNLANMQQNQQIQQNQLSQQNLQTQSNLQPQMFLMRNANSMVDLQNYQRQFYDGQQPQQQLQVQQLQQVQQNLPGQLIQQPSLQFLNSTKLVT